METSKGLRSIAILFRTLAGLLVLLIVVQEANRLTRTIDISYGVWFAETIRLVIFAGLLWGAGDLSDLFVKSHNDLRATRILLGRLAHLARPRPPAEAETSESDSTN